MTQEEILAKMVLLQKAMAGDNSPAFINKTLKNALEAAKISPDDLSKVRKSLNNRFFKFKEQNAKYILYKMIKLSFFWTQKY